MANAKPFVTVIAGIAIDNPPVKANPALAPASIVLKKLMMLKLMMTPSLAIQQESYLPLG